MERARALGRWQRIRFGFELFVTLRTFDRIGVVTEDALDPFREKQARTIDERVEHPRG